MSKRIWIVDDEPLVRAAMVAVLAEAGYESRPFGSAEELYVALVDGEKPDLLVLDHMLPDEDGSTIVRSLRERPEYQDIPVMFVTAIAPDEAERLADLAPVLTKPFDVRDLVARAQERLGEEPTAATL